MADKFAKKLANDPLFFNYFPKKTARRSNRSGVQAKEYL